MVCGFGSEHVWPAGPSVLPSICPLSLLLEHCCSGPAAEMVPGQMLVILRTLGQTRRTRTEDGVSD